MSTPIVIIRLLICTVIFILPCCKAHRGYIEWYRDLKTSRLDEAIKIGVEKVENRYRSEDIILSNVSRLTMGSPAHGQLIESMPSKNGHSASRTAEILIEASKHLRNSYGVFDERQCGIDLSIVNLTGTILGAMCMSEYNNSNLCTGKNLDYRSADGSCNNLKRNYLGKANTAYKRLLFPEYTDGISEMPNFYEKKLPDPRLVSTTLVKDEDSPDHTKTMMMAYWAMFIGHDLSHTAVSTMGMHIKHLTMNQATHYLDASMIYGTSEEQTLSLRQMSFGLLSVEKRWFFDPSSDLMPLETNDTNVCQNGPGTCYRAGDTRANAYPQLNAVYTMWVREHNRIARELYKENLFWSDEELFREAKKITTAFIQHITYNEWLPALLGVNYTKENGLGLEYRTKYDETADPSVSNSFATAILPFANSMIGDSISGYQYIDGPSKVRTHPGGQYGTLKGNYNQPLTMNKSLHNMLLGLTVQPTQKVDMLFTESVIF
ncbi:peroxidasin-like [Acyrthosiphon pisum]|uniref:Peroxidase n=1 Tax=Acyrthosiphon pisum TaxID=7029 RepID=A0A8R2JVS1_ACYPI|nr:peroxidasin-like [Acyrthosiphon pisum]